MLPNAGSQGGEVWADQASSLHSCWFNVLWSYEPLLSWSCCLFVCRLTSSSTDNPFLTSFYIFLILLGGGQRSCCSRSLPVLLHPDAVSGAKLLAAKHRAACSACQVLRSSQTDKVKLQAEIYLSAAAIMLVSISPTSVWLTHMVMFVFACRWQPPSTASTVEGTWHMSLPVADPLMVLSNTNIRFTFPCCCVGF